MLAKRICAGTPGSGDRTGGPFSVGGAEEEADDFKTADPGKGSVGDHFGRDRGRARSERKESVGAVSE